MLGIYSRSDFAKVADAFRQNFQNDKQAMANSIMYDSFDAVFNVVQYNNLAAAQAKAALLTELANMAQESESNNEPEEMFWMQLQRILFRILAEGANDEWSGRSNDVRRVVFRTKVDIAQDLGWVVERNLESLLNK